MFVIACYTPGIDPGMISNLFTTAGFREASPSVENLNQEIVTLNQTEKKIVFDIKNAQDLVNTYNKTGIKDTRFIALYTNPLHLIASLLENNDVSTIIESQLQDWYADVRHIIGFYKKNRSRCTVIDINNCLENPLKFIQLIRPDHIEHFDKWLLDKNAKISPITLWVAQQLLDKSMEIKNIYNELEACSVDINIQL